MENSRELEEENKNDVPFVATDENAGTYPPKFQKKENRANVWLKSATSLALYLILGYYVFQSFQLLLLITLIVVIHEMGHFIAMKCFRYKDLGIFFIPLLGAYVSGTKRDVSQKESAIILLAGPLPGIIIGIVFYLLYNNNPFASINGISYYTVAIFFLFLNIINLLPIYPLDGGQLLNRVFLDEETWVSKIFVWLSIAAMAWFAISKGIYPLLIFPLMMVMRMFGDTKLDTVEEEIEAAGISLDTSYEDLPDEDYWKIRNILITHHPSFKDVPLTPPFTYHPKEERIMSTIQSMLHRHLIHDVSIAGKILILLVCLAAISSPWLLNMDLSFFARFGF